MRCSPDDVICFFPEWRALRFLELTSDLPCDRQVPPELPAHWTSSITRVIRALIPRPTTLSKHKPHTSRLPSITPSSTNHAHNRTTQQNTTHQPTKREPVALPRARPRTDYLTPPTHRTAPQSARPILPQGTKKTHFTAPCCAAQPPLSRTARRVPAVRHAKRVPKSRSAAATVRARLGATSSGTEHIFR
jgi:hypothetical protein